jgi:endogenous inhibitor of DNA gyrase (YacG/DUF329 family)
MSKTCPLCDKPTAKEYAPFCSRRCADVDLQRWLSGLYAIPAVEQDASDDEPEPGRRED